MSIDAAEIHAADQESAHVRDARARASAVAAYWRTLRDAGVTPALAAELTKDWAYHELWPETSYPSDLEDDD